MDQPRFQVAGIAKVHRFKLFAAFVERVQLEIGGRMVEPRHALGGSAPVPCRHNHFEPAEMPPCVRHAAGSSRATEFRGSERRR